MAQRIVRLASAAVLQLAVLVLAHQLVYMARYGSRFGEELQHAGHGEAWTIAVVSSAVLAAALLIVAGLRLAYLGTLIRRHGAAHGDSRAGLERGALIRAWLRVAPRLAVLTAGLLTVQENLEHAALGQSMPGPGILLTEEYQGGLWITLAAALGVSLVAALFDWRRRILEARLRAARPAVRRRVATLPSRPGLRARRPIDSLLGRKSALRAPPPAPVAA